MIVAVGAVSLLTFTFAFVLCGIIPVARRAVSTLLAALGAMRSTTLDDAARERAVQRAALALFVSFASIVLRAAAVLAVSALVPLLADQAGLAPLAAVVALLGRWDFIFAASVCLGAGWVIKERMWPSR